MTTPADRTGPSILRVLVVEQNDEAVAPLTRALEGAHPQLRWMRVDALATLSAAVASEDTWDVLLCADDVAGVKLEDALALVRDGAHPPLPLVVLSSSLDEATAVSALGAGADGFVPRPRLARLAATIERLLRAYRGRAEQERGREQVLVSERLSAMGTLASAVAHELNNPLAAVIANLELALRDLERPPSTPAELDELKAELGDAHQAAFQLRQIVRDVKILSRPEGDRVAPIDVRTVMDAVTRLLSNEIRHRARLRTSYGVVPPVWATETRVGHALLNLVLHVAHGIAPGRAGSNEILLSVGTDPQGHARIEIAAKDTSAVPLPTTVVPTSTLALTVSRRLVREMGGDIQSEPQPERGVLLVVRLPAADVPRRGGPAR